ATNLSVTATRLVPSGFRPSSSSLSSTERAPIDECQRVQAVNAGNLIFAFYVVQTAGRNHKRRLPTLFRKRHTCRVNFTQRPSELLTDRPQFCAGFCLSPPSIGHGRYYSETAGENCY